MCKKKNRLVIVSNNPAFEDSQRFQVTFQALPRSAYSKLYNDERAVRKLHERNFRMSHIAVLSSTLPDGGCQPESPDL